MEKALVAALAEMSVQGVSTRKLKAITEELCGQPFSASAISAINKKLDESEPITRRLCARREICKAGERRELKAFSGRLEEAFPYVILDARYERIRKAGVIARSGAHRSCGGVRRAAPSARPLDLGKRESHLCWKDLSVALKRRGLSGVEYVVSDDHAGLKAAIREVLPEAASQRCTVHFLRNALDYAPRKADDDCLREPRFMDDRRDLGRGQTRSRPVARKVAGHTPSFALGSRTTSKRH